ncbi:trypsin-like cysteine/serine peptidase domain-containing protein [Coemansia mojavensis]|nr:trypsin-like cysteine/serine peptidase domain-containing protein [Coemansia mojavensis]KAJ1743150.1 hypothetical protein LPJ68_001269 [Coemansia sp. RSA 1086]
MFTSLRIISSTILSSLAGGLAIPTLERRIIGGYDLPDNAAPFEVHLTSTTDDGLEFVCGGTLVTNRHIVTAAHCVYQPNNQLYAPNSIKVGYGSDKLSEQLATAAIKVTPHSQYGVNTDKGVAVGVNDIAVIEVEPLQTNQFVAPIEIFKGSLPANSELIAVGWGAQVSNNSIASLAKELKAVKLLVGDMEGCRKFDPFYIDANGSRICTLNRPRPGNSTCKGDSGSGAFVIVDSKIYLAGVDSQGGRQNDPSCGTDDGYTLFTNVSNYTPFISQVIEESNSSQ